MPPAINHSPRPRGDRLQAGVKLGSPVRVDRNKIFSLQKNKWVLGTPTCFLQHLFCFGGKIRGNGLQHFIRIQSMYCTSLLQRLSNRGRATHAMHTRLHENIGNSPVVRQHVTHCSLFCNFHDAHLRFFVNFLPPFPPGFLFLAQQGHPRRNGQKSGLQQVVKSPLGPAFYFTG